MLAVIRSDAQVGSWSRGRHHPMLLSLLVMAFRGLAAWGAPPSAGFVLLHGCPADSRKHVLDRSVNLPGWMRSDARVELSQPDQFPIQLAKLRKRFEQFCLSICFWSLGRGGHLE